MKTSRRHPSKIVAWSLVIGGLAGLPACGGGGTSTEVTSDSTSQTFPPVEKLGDPLPGLSTDELAAFAEGRSSFEEAETAEDGLGPIFNNTSCVACHSAPVSGGASAQTVTRFGLSLNGRFDPLTTFGGTLLHQNAIDPEALERVPSEANVIARRLTTPLFGLGLVEAIPDAAILANAQRQVGDGIAGKAAMIKDIASGQIRVGRFGWKNQHATLLAFAGDAYLNEMGITNRLFPKDLAPNGNTALLKKFDRIPDLEDVADIQTGRSDIDKLADFMRLLAPPPPARLNSNTLRGQLVFQRINCSGCHVPNMQTGSSSSAEALSNRSVQLYSDLLLHDMGTLGDGIAQAAAETHQMRTAPLWGLSARRPLLHDGRAATLLEAIMAHEGEATIVRDRFDALSPQEKQQLLDFLDAL